MPEPFKNAFNRQLITGMAEHFQKHWAAFDADGFSSSASKDLESLELKQRSEHIMQAMDNYLPDDFNHAGEIMLACLSPASPRPENPSPTTGNDFFGDRIDEKGIAGWAIMPMAHYVGLRGHHHFDLSMTLLKEMTKRWSSEFGIRFFLLAAPEQTLAVLKTWTTDTNKHVRRLVSEGTRPRLPWAMRLPPFINNPAPVIELLELLKDDNDEYVRRSVANNLNDIAKDHPDIVADIAAAWMQDASPERKKIIRHACRTLIKQGNTKVLKTLGYEPADIQPVHIDVATPEVLFGTTLQFSISIISNTHHSQALMIDYIIHHQKANGKISPKVFKWSTRSLAAKATITLTKKHPIKAITTRVYYPGLHRVEVMINGISMETAGFQLLMP